MYLVSITETINVTLLHPCKTTIITTSQTINNITYTLDDPASVLTFLPFNDSVSTQYSVNNLCGLVYSLSLAATATTYGATVNSAANSISVQATNYLLIGTSAQLVLSAAASTSVQDIAS